MTATTYGVWDKEMGDWDSFYFATLEEAVRHTYCPPLAAGADLSKHRPSKQLVVREYLARGEAGQIIR